MIHHLFQPIFGSKFSWLIWCICLTGLLFFGIPLLYYIFFPLIFFNLKPSKTFCLRSVDIYFSLSIFYSSISELFFGEVFEALAILSAILFPIKSPVASAVFWIDLFDAVLIASAADCLV